MALCDLCGVEPAAEGFHVIFRRVAGLRAQTAQTRIIGGEACPTCARRFTSFRRLRVAGILLFLATFGSFIAILETDAPAGLLSITAAGMIAFIVVVVRLAGWHRRTAEEILGGEEAVARQLALVPEVGALLQRTFITVYPGAPSRTVDARVSEVRLGKRSLRDALARLDARRRK